MKKIDVKNLPRKKYGTTTHIDWEQAVGCKISFQYDQIKGQLKIENHFKGNSIEISYKNKTKKLRTNHLFEFKWRDLIYDSRKKLQKLDLKNIPKKNGKYDWIHSIGKTIPFEFNGVLGELLITNYIRINQMGYLIIEYEKEKYKIRNINLLNGKIAKIVSYGKYHYQIGQQIKDQYKNITIITRKRLKDKQGSIVRKKYKYHCNQCDYEGWIDETLISISKISCSHCAKKIALRGKTDLNTEAPWLALFFQKKDKHLIYTERKNSSKKIYPICPECKQIRQTPMQISTIYKYHSIVCPCCSDRVSYPEKFIQEFFRQLGVKLLYQPKKTELNWCKNYYYDFYDPKQKVIIEVNGMHHYKEIKHYNKTLEEVKVIDQKKKDLVIKNNMQYLEIDCRYSNLEYIKKSLLNHKELREIYPFHENQIDFNKCELATIKSIYYKIYKYKKNHPNITYKDLEEKYRINRYSISKALRRMSQYLKE